MLDKKKENAAIRRTNKVKYLAKGLQGIKTISNTLGTKPTDTPDVDTKIIREYKRNGSDKDKKDNSGDRSYQLDGEGKGYFADEKALPIRKQNKRATAY